MTFEADRMSTAPQSELRTSYIRKGRRLQYLTIAWNCGEFLIALVAGYIAGSIALVGFGVDSAIEVASSMAALWRLWRDDDHASRELAEQNALKFIGTCFMVLAFYITYESIYDLANKIPPHRSVIGVVLASFSLIVMPWLAHLKRKIAVRLESSALEAETRQTEICAYLSAILLLGLGLNAWLEWWWADPLAGLAMVPFIAWEGWQAFRGRACCDH